MIAFMVGRARSPAGGMADAIKLYSFDRDVPVEGVPRFDLLGVIFYGDNPMAEPWRRDYDFSDAMYLASWLNMRGDGSYNGSCVAFNLEDEEIAARLTARIAAARLSGG